MPTQRIALKTHHFDDCLNVCEPDAQFLEAFAKVRALLSGARSSMSATEPITTCRPRISSESCGARTYALRSGHVCNC